MYRPLITGLALVVLPVLLLICHGINMDTESSMEENKLATLREEDGRDDKDLAQLLDAPKPVSGDEVVQTSYDELGAVGYGEASVTEESACASVSNLHATSIEREIVQRQVPREATSIMEDSASSPGGVQNVILTIQRTPQSKSTELSPCLSWPVISKMIVSNDPSTNLLKNDTITRELQDGGQRMVPGMPEVGLDTKVLRVSPDQKIGESLRGLSRGAGWGGANVRFSIEVAENNIDITDRYFCNAGGSPTDQFQFLLFRELVFKKYDNEVSELKNEEVQAWQEYKNVKTPEGKEWMIEKLDGEIAPLEAELEEQKEDGVKRGAAVIAAEEEKKNKTKEREIATTTLQALEAKHFYQVELGSRTAARAQIATLETDIRTLEARLHDLDVEKSKAAEKHATTKKKFAELISMKRDAQSVNKLFEKGQKYGDYRWCYHKVPYQSDHVKFYMVSIARAAASQKKGREKKCSESYTGIALTILEVDRAIWGFDKIRNGQEPLSEIASMSGGNKFNLQLEFADDACPPKGCMAPMWLE